MEVLEFGSIVILGLIFGSFLNVLILRLRKNMTLFGRSQCTNCQTTLPAKHLVPVLSWMALRGRCAFCRHPIHIQYPLVEGASALLLLLAYVQHPIFVDSASWSAFIVESCFLLLLLALVVFDLRWKLLPIEPIVGATLIFAAWNIVSGTLSWTSVIVGVVVGGGFLGVQVLLSRGRAMGGGDPWLGMLLGAMLGWPQIGVALYFTYIVGGGLMLILFLLGIVRKGSRIPFAPLLALGTLGSMLAGTMMEAWVRAVL